MLTYGYSASGHAHAPASVGANAYQYDANGNLTGAEERTYGYNYDNRLSQVLGGANSPRGYAYDGDGSLRIATGTGLPTRHHLAPEYQVAVGMSEPTLYYRFGGRALAWAKGRACATCVLPSSGGN